MDGETDGLVSATQAYVCDVRVRAHAHTHTWSSRENIGRGAEDLGFIFSSAAEPWTSVFSSIKGVAGPARFLRLLPPPPPLSGTAQQCRLAALLLKDPACFSRNFSDSLQA